MTERAICASVAGERYHQSQNENSCLFENYCSV